MARPSPTPACPDCDRPPTLLPVGRRDFLRGVAASAAALTVGGAAPLTPLARAARARAERQAAAEHLVFELAKSMNGDQRKQLVLPWDHGQAGGLPARLVMVNAPVGKSVIGEEYTPKQVELLDRIFRSIANGEEGYRLLSRGGNFDDSGDFKGLGAVIYGDPAPGQKFSLVFAGHHLTVRCDGNSEDGAAFGGPLYYGHSPNGYSQENVFHHQTAAVREVFGALDPAQRKRAVLDGSPGEQAASVRLRGRGDRMPGLPVGELAADQRALVERVMRVLVAPYRKEDGDEVMELVTANGGLGTVSLAFYRDKSPTDEQPWHFWRLEGPGFVWNFRVLPHVHTFVHVRRRAA